MPRRWLSQADLIRFALDEYLAAKPAIGTFLMIQYSREIKVGDPVIMKRNHPSLG
jgi:hypothetical protein